MLPRLSYRGGKVSRQTMAFYGLNLSENVKEGELKDSIGISTGLFPALTQRAERSVVNGYTSPSDLFEWDGKLVVVDEGMLKYDGSPLCNVSDGRKSFAVINSRLIIFPDKLSVDLRNAEVIQMDVTVTNTGVSAFTHNSLHMSLESAAYSSTSHTYIAYFPGGPSTLRYPYIWTYGSALWDENDGWTLTDPQAMYYGATDLSQFAGRYVIPEATYQPRTNKYSFRLSFTDNPGDAPPTPGNSLGFYGVLKKPDLTVWHNYNAQGHSAINIKQHVAYYYDAWRNREFISELLYEGDCVSITGTRYGFYDVDKVIVAGVDKTTNTLSFADNTFRTDVPFVYAVTASALSAGGTRILKYSTGTYPNPYYYYSFTYTETIPAGSVLYVTSAEDRVYVMDPDTHVILNSYATERRTSDPGGTSITVGAYNQDGMQFVVQRQIPNMDLVCAADNRLWGVDKENNSIHCSSLGLPWQFYHFEGVDTDSWSLAVGSEGDWTGICQFNGSVLCWKENRLHKISGSYPSEFYMTTYDVDGVQAGSERAMVIINNALYYKGVHGVYYFNGYQPSEISYNLGPAVLTDAVAGYDGERYYIGCKSGDDALLFTYDLTHGLWAKEDEAEVIAISNAGGSLYMLRDGSVVLSGDPESTESVKWMAELAPISEGIANRKGYTKLILRLEMEPGSSVRVETKEDKRPWHDVKTIRSDRNCSAIVPIRLGRCDHIRIRLSGKGRSIIRSMTREFIVGSEVP